jgi:cobalamin biosynthesis protein CobW
VTRGVPVLVVSGFLGSGKTTLVRHLLADAQRTGTRLAVISNEFGELGIDRELLGDARDEYVELHGGCVCCRLSDALVDTLQSLRERAHPDRIVVETSGVALPYDTQLNFWREPVCQWIEDDVVVVVVNAEQLAAGRDLGDTFEQQVSSADFLLLNQIDRVSDAAIPELEARLRTFEPEAPIVPVARAAVAPALLFPPDPAGRRARRAQRAEPRTSRPHGQESFETQTLDIPPGLEAGALLERLRALGALRAKGFVVTREGLRLVQGVGPRIEILETDRTPPPELLGRIVVIHRSEG